ncbi:MAG: hypothetical protein R3344_14100 [Acidobacteriota bacterium]|nr:hypothetical protein [Acidobacteriota bacterium]
MTHAALVSQLSISSDAAGALRDRGNLKDTATFANEDTGGSWEQDVEADGVEVELPLSGLSDAKAVSLKTERIAAGTDPLPTLSLRLGSTATETISMRADDNGVALFLATLAGVDSLFVTNPVPTSGNPVKMRVTWGAVGSA